MKFIHYLGLFLLSGLILTGGSYFQSSPGYMDAEYYFAGSMRLFQGHGFSEVILWNYLDDPAGIPHPAFGYWMPLTSLVGLIPLAGFPLAGFMGVKLFFGLLAALISPLTAGWTNRLTGRKDWAILAGCLAIFPGFYLPYLSTSDTFGICMLLGLAWFFLVSRQSGWLSRSPAGWFDNHAYLLLGMTSGMFHLARAEGLIWLFLSLSVVLLQRERYRTGDFKSSSALRDMLKIGLGYLIVMGPWMGRNLIVFGSPFSPGGGRAFWLTSYDELFAYPASQLTLSHWWKSGLVEILKTRMWAFEQNLQTAGVVQGEIILLPLVLISLWRNKEHLVYKAATLAWLGLLIIMTVFFPFQGARGGFFHAGAALQPIIWLSTPIGLDQFVMWGRRARGWNAAQAFSIFGVAIVSLAAFITGSVFSKRVIGNDWLAPVWNQPAEDYQQAADYLNTLGVRPDEVVMANNPPGFFLASGLPVIVIPNESLGRLLETAHRYQARYLVIDNNHPQPLHAIYLHPQDQPGLNFLIKIKAMLIFQIQ
jgi:hypothetical protein